MGRSEFVTGQHATESPLVKLDDSATAIGELSSMKTSHSEDSPSLASETATAGGERESVATGDPAIDQPESASSNSGRTMARLNHALGPIGAGMIIDAVDLITYGPVLGIPVGSAAGYWLGRSMRLEPHMCWICAAVAGIYCTVPGTELMPLGTLVGALMRFQNDEGDTR